MNRPLVQTDTAAWVLQVWISFGIALFAAGFGVFNLAVDWWIKGFVGMGYLFSIAATFTLAKTIRDNRYYRTDTSAWILQVWISFGLAVLLTAAGLLRLPVEFWVRGYLAVGLFFALASSFTLAKTIRDNDEAAQLLAQMRGPAQPAPAQP